MTKYTTGALTNVQVHIEDLARYVDRWRDGTFTTYEMATLSHKTSERLSKACWCAEGVCCPAHNVHVSPHRHCVVR